MLEVLHRRLLLLPLTHPRAALVVLALAVFAVVFSGDFNSLDTQRRLQVTHWIWSAAPQVAADDADPEHRLPGRGGEFFAPYGIGQPLVMLPGDILTRLLVDDLIAGRASPVVREKIRSAIEAFVTFSAVDAACVVLSFELLQVLGFATAAALSATVLFVLGSTFLVYMQTAQENSLMYLCFVGALVFGLRAGRGRSTANLWIAGGFAGFSLLIKLTDLAFVPPLFLLLCWAHQRGQQPPHPSDTRWRAILRAASSVALNFGPPVAFGLLADRIYQFYRFGDVFGTYIDVQAAVIAKLGGVPVGYPFGFPFWEGFLGPFVTPEKSIFLFDPLILSLAIVAAAGGRIALLPKLVIATTSLALVLLAIAFGGTYWWAGSVAAWGPRHHLVPVEIICLVACALIVDRFAVWPLWARRLVVANAMLAVAFQFTALPKTAYIEGGQIALGDPLRVAPLMRIRNLVYIAAGDFHAKGLDYGDPMLDRMATVETENRLFVFRLGPYVPPQVARMLIGLWAVLAVLAAAGAAFILSLGFPRASVGLRSAE